MKWKEPDMYAYRTRFVTDGKPRLELELPPEFPQGRQKVEVVVMVDDRISAGETEPIGSRARIEEERDAWEDSDRRVESAYNKCKSPGEAPLSEAFFAWLDSQTATGRTRAEIDAEITEERNAWRDD
jgi:hypothetical protein